MNRVLTDKRPICSIQVPDKHDISRRLTTSSSSRFVGYGVCGGKDTSVICSVWFSHLSNSKTNVLLLGNQERIKLVGRNRIFFCACLLYCAHTCNVMTERPFKRFTCVDSIS